MALDAFKPGDRVELVLHYSFWGDPPPQGTVVSTTSRRIRCKMDRSGKLITYLPGDLRRLAASGAKRGVGVEGRGPKPGAEGLKWSPSERRLRPTRRPLPGWLTPARATTLELPAMWL